MFKLIKGAVAALTIAGVTAGAVLPASAQGYYDPRYERDYRYDRDYRYERRGNDTDWGPAIVAGVIGLALGAALADNDHDNRRDRYNHRYYNDRYYDRYGGYDRSYGRTCERRERAWDSYGRRDVWVTRRYRC